MFTDGESGACQAVTEKNGIYTLDTCVGQKIVVRTAGAKKISIIKDYSKNMGIKYLGESKLGTEKEY